MNRHPRYVRAVGGVDAIYWLAAKAGLQLAYLRGSIAALWPPVGVGMAILILYGPRLWPGIVAGGPCGLRFLAAIRDRAGAKRSATCWRS
jgi:integral membrane sensor domain MASE1